MPILRVNAYGQRQFASPGMFDLNGRPAFVLGAGETERLAVDWTGALRGETIAGSDWTVSGATVSGEATDGGIASALIGMPAGCGLDILAINAITTSGGRTLSQALAILPEAR